MKTYQIVLLALILIKTGAVLAGDLCAQKDKSARVVATLLIVAICLFVCLKAGAFSLIF